MINGEPIMAHTEQPKTYKIPSRSYGITASEAADTLLQAEEIKKNKPLNKVALAELKAKKKAISEIV